MTAPANLPIADIEAIYAEGLADPVYWCRFFLPHYFPEDSPVPWFHRGIIAIFTQQCAFLETYGELDKIMSNFVWSEDPANSESPTHPIFFYDDAGTLCMEIKQFSSLLIPRGFSKTTIVNALTLRDICYKLRNFIVYISEAGPHAEQQLSNIKHEITENERINLVYGMLKPTRQSGKPWAAQKIECTNGTTLIARGRNAQVRGANDKAQRPDKIIFDDVEDKESVSTPEQRKKVRSWAYSDVFPALPRGDKTATVVALGTLLHAEALMKIFENDPTFTSIVFGCLDRQGEPLWDSPFGMSADDIETKRHVYALAGELEGYYMEYHSKLHDEATAKFRKEFFRWEIINPTEFIAKALAVDPAISDKVGADFCGFGVVGMTQKGQIHVLEAEGKKGMSPRDQVDKYFELWLRWKPEYSGVESNAYQAALVHLIREEMFRKSTKGAPCYHEVTPITHSTKKTERVEGVLQPRYAAGYIIHARKHLLLESQLVDWPRGKKDLPDVIAMAVTLLDPYAAAAADPDMDLADDEYEPLGQLMNGAWQTQI